MIDFTPLFVLLGVLGVGVSVVACFGIVFGLKLKKGAIELEINADKVKAPSTSAITDKLDRLESEVRDIDDRTKEIESELENKSRR